MSYPTTPVKSAFSFGTPAKGFVFGTPKANAVSVVPTIAPKYPAATMRMGLAQPLLRQNPPKRPNNFMPKDPELLETKVLGVFNERTGKGWVKSRKGRKGRKSRKTRRMSRK